METLSLNRLIGNDELLEIMLTSDYKTLSQLCQINVYTQNICNTNNFWIEKLAIDYPDIYYNYNILVVDSDYSDNVLKYMKTNAKHFYGTVVDFYQCSSTETMMNFINTLYLLSLFKIDINRFINMLLLVYTDKSLEDKLHKYNVDLYSGNVIISALLPPGLMFVMGSVVIMDGILIKGVLITPVINLLLENIKINYGDDVVEKFKRSVNCISNIALLYKTY